MPSGLQVYGADGSLQVDSTTNMTRVLGTMERSEPHVQNFVGHTIAWPYPNIPGRRIVATVSKYPISEGENSTAWAYYNSATGNVHFDRGDDIGPVTLLFMVY
ncbi:hypothetical protein vBPpSSYP_135 [Pseudomonas phage vB_PpS_SYP]|nr:hypothetical protein vBPpSSYP_135 [Pseudomonas phage vB_PpS_SYP]